MSHSWISRNSALSETPNRLQVQESTFVAGWEKDEKGKEELKKWDQRKDRWEGVDKTELKKKAILDKVY